MEPRTSSPRRAGLALSLAQVLALGCQQSLPAAPSELATGITVYEHANFLGQAAHITSDSSDLRDFHGPCEHISADQYGTSFSYDWNDCISSVRVAPGWRATIYKDTGYRDDSLAITGDVPNLLLVLGDCEKGGLNDCVSSVRVRAQ
jgi:hypothetical protein